MAETSSDELISDDFPFWLQCETATAKVRYAWYMCRRLLELSSAFDLLGSLLSIVLFHLVALDGDESSSDIHSAGSMLKRHSSTVGV